MKYFFVLLLLFVSICPILNSQTLGIYYTAWGACTYPPDSLPWATLNSVNGYVIWFNASALSTSPYISLSAGSSDSINFETSAGYCGNSNNIIAQKMVQLSQSYGGKTKLLISILDNKHILDNLVQDTSVGGKCDQLIASWFGFAHRHHFTGIDVDNEYPYDPSSSSYLQTQKGWEVFFRRAKTLYPNDFITVAVPTWGLWGVNQATPIYSQNSWQYINYVQLMAYNEMAKTTAGHNGPLYKNYGGGWYWDYRGWHEYNGPGLNVPKNKIVYLVSAEGHKMTESTTPAILGATSSGNYSFYQYSTFPLSIFSSLIWDSSAQATYAVSGNTLYSIEDSKSITAKYNYITKNGLAGIGVYDPWRWQHWGGSTKQDPMMSILAGLFTGVQPPPPPQVLTMTLSGSGTDTVGRPFSFTVSSNMAVDSFKVTTTGFSIKGLSTPSTSVFTPTKSGVYAIQAQGWKGSQVALSNILSLTVYDSILHVTNCNIAGTLRDNFNRQAGSLNGELRWTNILNQPGNGSIVLNNDSTISPYNAFGYNNFGGVVWDSIVTNDGTSKEISVTVKQRTNTYYTTCLFLYVKMNNKDYNTGTGYRLRFWEEPTQDIFQIHRVGPGYANSVVIASIYTHIKVGDIITFKVGCDGTLYGLINGVQLLSAKDNVYNPSQWYFAIRGGVFQTPVKFDDFKISLPESIPLTTVAKPSMEENQIPNKKVMENYPNPFNPSTTFTIDLPFDGKATLTVYNMLGQEVAKILDESTLHSGVNTVDFNAADLTSGIYFAILNVTSMEDQTKYIRETKKIVVLK